MTTAADRPDGVAHRAPRGRRWVGRVGWPVLAVLGVLVLMWTLRLGDIPAEVVAAKLLDEAGIVGSPLVAATDRRRSSAGG